MSNDIVSVEEMRLRDAATIAAGTPGIELMRRAASGIYDSYDGWRDGTVILAGSGNNGGDGFALAEILAREGFSCRIFVTSDKRTPDSAYYERRAAEAGADISAYDVSAGLPLDCPVIVDCLLGTGFSGIPREPVASAIREINLLRGEGAFVISADINSGMNGDTGEGADGLIVRSDLTVTIGHMKKGLVTDAARRYYDQIVVVDIGIQ